MNYKLIRDDFNEFGIFGQLFDADGNKIAETLEHSYPQDAGSFVPKVPAGVYTCQRHAPNRLPYETFELQNVPNATGILIHIGNYNKDSIGCILIGKSKLKIDRGMMIVASKETFEKFMDLQKDTNEFTLTVE